MDDRHNGEVSVENRRVVQAERLPLAAGIPVDRLDRLHVTTRQAVAWASPVDESVELSGAESTAAWPAFSWLFSRSV